MFNLSLFLVFWNLTVLFFFFESVFSYSVENLMGILVRLWKIRAFSSGEFSLDISKLSLLFILKDAGYLLFLVFWCWNLCLIFCFFLLLFFFFAPTFSFSPLLGFLKKKKLPQLYFFYLLISILFLLLCSYRKIILTLVKMTNTALFRTIKVC